MKKNLIGILALVGLTSACTEPVKGDGSGGDNNAQQDITVNFGAECTATYCFTTDTLAFPDTVVGSTAQQANVLHYNGDAAVDLEIGATDNSVWSIVSSDSVTLAPGGSTSIVVGFTPDAPQYYAGAISVTTSDIQVEFSVTGLGYIENADTGTPENLDNDGDGYDEYTGDCDDGNAAVHPGATEACNGIDDDCNGLVDDSDTCNIPDKDGDGWDEWDDCNDDSYAIHPGATEVCDDGIDDDCDGLIDADDPDCQDNDTGGGADTGDTGGDTGDSGDTDTDNDTGSGDTDTDNDTGSGDTGPIDADGDGYPVDTDCDDTNAAVNPSAEEICNGVDDNCDGTTDDLNVSFTFSSPGDGPQPWSEVTVYGYYDTGTSSCAGSDGPINLSICTNDASVFDFGTADPDTYKSQLESEIDSWVASAPLVDSDGTSYYAVDWSTPTSSDDEICIFVGVGIAAY